MKNENFKINYKIRIYRTVLSFSQMIYELKFAQGVYIYNSKESNEIMLMYG